MTRFFDFVVQGSDPEPYSVTIVISGKNVRASCTCMGAMFGSNCKHRLRILFDQPLEEMGPEDAQKVKELRELLPGTDVWEAHEKIIEAEAEVKKARGKVSKAKKVLAKTMADPNMNACG